MSADAVQLRVGGPRTLRSYLAHAELARALVQRELTVRYQRSLLGFAWALIEPCAMLAIYVLVFGKILQADRGIENYLLFTLLGLACWQFFSTTLENSAATLIDHAPLMRKVYFPRELVVGAVVVSRFTTFLLTLAIAVPVAVYAAAWGQTPVWHRAPQLLAGVLVLVAAVTGLSLLLAAANVLLRDTVFLVRFAMRLYFYACPIVYPTSLVPEGLRDLYVLNPMVGVLYLVQGFADPAVAYPGTASLACAIITSMALLFGGLWAFRRLEPHVADLL